MPRFSHLEPQRQRLPSCAPASFPIVDSCRREKRRTIVDDKLHDDSRCRCGVQVSIGAEVDCMPDLVEAHC